MIFFFFVKRRNITAIDAALNEEWQCAFVCVCVCVRARVFDPVLDFGSIEPMRGLSGPEWALMTFQHVVDRGFDF